MKLETSYMGLKLRSPVVVSACSLSDSLDNIVRMEDSGAGALVMFSLFEEHIRSEASKRKGSHAGHRFAVSEIMDFLPEEKSFRHPTAYLEKIRKAKARVEIPVIGSLNGISSEGWVNYARLMEEAGADGIELNIFYIPGNMGVSSAEVENQYIEIIRAIREGIRIPLAIKLNPYFSALGNMALQMEDAGANALVLFNRFYQPDFDIEELVIRTDLPLSDSSEIRLPLLWTGLLFGKTGMSLAASTGVQSSQEVIKYILAGADVVMTASTLYRNGIEYISTMNRELTEWMARMDFDDLRVFRGIMSQRRVTNPIAYERANYIRILDSRK